jgi:ADP-ribose pyrophosphatase
MSDHEVSSIEVVEDFSSTGRCDEGFLQIRRLRVRNLRVDGTASVVYRVDVVDRPKLDAVAVLVWRTSTSGAREFLTRLNLRPAAYFRKDKSPTVPDLRSHLFCEEIVAGLLEQSDAGEAGLLHRAAEEVKEEAGFTVEPSKISRLGPAFFVAPGIISEKIFLCAVDVTGLTQHEARTDGSPLEEGGDLFWRSEAELSAKISSGEINDAKTEIALARLRSLT